ncbi:hypothetical protein LTR36_009956 [Oleoguttula mirabilis]|uniref:DUF3835 domain-containing protein n=1 Tax=Oleoguttula mirabilis TaxID=1507867 RepID=A0AAV9J5I9_9PEZI|nr:hypothetical protein LTR36_009956 [Oleoguttula mirabilis]
MDLLRVEQQRQSLEEHIRKLRQSLKYWQTFEAEYEGLKEEIQEAQPVIDAAKLTELSESYDGELVTKDVVRELAGLDKDSPRSGPQIVRDIERRQEYVQKNIDTIQRRFFEAEAKLEEFDFAASRDSSGALPLTEIHEELDDDDNVISSQLVQPEASQTKLVETLRKAGLTAEDLDGESPEGKTKEPLKPALTTMSPPITPSPALVPTIEKRTKSAPNLPISDGDSSHDDGPARPPIRKKSVSFTVDTKEPPEIVRFESEDGCKKVSFAEKVAIAPAAPLPDMRSVQFSPKVEEIPPQPLGPASPAMVAQASTGSAQSAAQSEVQKDLRASFKPGETVKVLNGDDEVMTEEVVLPENETEEDAQTRREMLDYHLNEIGHVVAEMNLDGGDDYNDIDDEDYDDDDDASSHITSSTHAEDEDTPYTSGLSDEDEDEDEHGRTKRKVVTGDYRRKMLEMQQRLIGNLGPTPEDEDITDADAELDARDVRRLVIRDKRNSVSSASSDSSEKKVGGGGGGGVKKRVSFADALDVAEAGSPPLKAQKHLEGEAVAPVSDAVTERATTTSHVVVPGSATPAKASRFKKARASPAARVVETPDEDDYEDATPSGPPGRTLADTLVERPASSKSTSAPSEEDLDPVAERRQLAAEYYRRRNEMVRQQGGFKGNPDEDEELGELMEERDGKVKKVSRFKAARITGPQ